MQRLGILEERMTVFCGANHLEMVRFANKFDLDDPEVIDSLQPLWKGNKDYAFSMCTLTVTPTEPLQIFGILQRRAMYTHLFSNTMKVLKESGQEKILMNFVTPLRIWRSPMYRKNPFCNIWNWFLRDISPIQVMKKWDYILRWPQNMISRPAH